MAETPQNGAAADPKQVQIPEGDRYLLIRLDKDNHFQVVFSDAASAIMLDRLGSAWIEEHLVKPSVRPQPTPAIAVPGGLDIGSLGRLQRSMKRDQ